MANGGGAAVDKCAAQLSLPCSLCPCCSAVCALPPPLSCAVLSFLLSCLLAALPVCVPCYATQLPSTWSGVCEAKRLTTACCLSQMDLQQVGAGAATPGTPWLDDGTSLRRTRCFPLRRTRCIPMVLC